MTPNIRVLVIGLIVVTGLFLIGLHRLKLDSDITASLPKKDGVISEAFDILKNHPIQDRIAIDVGVEKRNPDLLVKCGRLIEQRLDESNLFAHVGTKDAEGLAADLVFHVLDSLPLMFTEKELEEKVSPLLEHAKIHETLQNVYMKLLGLEGIGQGEFIARDPLALKDIILSKLSFINPAQDAVIYDGSIISRDGKHLLVTAQSKTSSADTAFAHSVSALIRKISNEINSTYSKEGHPIILTPVGAFRAAVDNESIIRRDVKRAVLPGIIGVAVLLWIAFPRPLLGLLCLLPAMAGTMVAFFIYTLIYPSMSVIVLGFGGAIISITVDHAIAYLLFLDRPHETHGKTASKEVLSIGLLAVLTTVGAFLTLCLSGFPILEELGLFTALGVAFSFLFVHAVFPATFSVLRPGSTRKLPLHNMVERFSMSGKKGAFAVVMFGLIMAFFSKPVFDVNLSSMNTLSQDTAKAEKMFSKTWGGISGKTYLMTKGKTVADLQRKGDDLLDSLEQDLASGVVTGAFVPSMIFPGERRSARNYAAWRHFWNAQRRSDVKAALDKAASDFGFAPDAFAPFLTLITPPKERETRTRIPEKLFSLLGISKKASPSEWVQFAGLTLAEPPPSKAGNAQAFYERYRSFGKIFQPALFSERLGGLLFSIFLKMFTIVGMSVAALLFVFFWNWKLTLACLIPIVFAFTSTLGTLKLTGRPLDIAAMMPAIIVMGMGVDYSIFFVRAYQQYGRRSHPSFALIRMAVFMSAASTLVGFGILSFAEHSVLRSAGFAMFCGIGYSLIATFVILPPLMELYGQRRKK